TLTGANTLARCRTRVPPNPARPRSRIRTQPRIVKADSPSRFLFRDKQRRPFLEKRPTFPVNERHHHLRRCARRGNSSEQRLCQQNRRGRHLNHSSHVERYAPHVIRIFAHCRRTAHVRGRDSRPHVSGLLLIIHIHRNQ